MANKFNTLEDQFDSVLKRITYDENSVGKEFIFAKDDLAFFEGKSVVVKYDNKEFSGTVIGTNYRSEVESGLIMKSDRGSVKHIKNYRMSDLRLR